MKFLSLSFIVFFFSWNAFSMQIEEIKKCLEEPADLKELKAWVVENRGDDFGASAEFVLATKLLEASEEKLLLQFEGWKTCDDYKGFSITEQKKIYAILISIDDYIDSARPPEGAEQKK